MGSQFCTGTKTNQHDPVLQLPNQLPNDKRYLLFRGKTNRYNQLSVINVDSNNYIFTLQLDRSKQIRIKLTVLNQIAHRVVHVNYKLKISNYIVIDPMDKSYQNTLILVRNTITGIQYHMKVVPFVGYNSIQFKKVLQEIWIYQNKITKNDKHLFHSLQQAFIYGINPDQQACIMLFQKIDGDLLHIGQYRQQSHWQWTDAQKIKIILNLVQGLIRLKELNIIHRNISPSTLYLNSKSNRYVLGNFNTSRQIHDNDDLLTVYGSQMFSQGKLVSLIKHQSNMGIYNINQSIYSSLKNIMNYLQSLNITNKTPNTSLQVFRNIKTKINQNRPIYQILDYLHRIENEWNIKGLNLTDDNVIAYMTQSLLFQKYRTLAQDYQFRTYQLLGYYSQFSEMAHKIIDSNNQNDKAFQNAKIMKDLGHFYEKNGTGGIQYLLNACVLYCRQAQKDIDYKLYQKADQNLQQAQKIYLQLSHTKDFSLNLIQINRLRSLLLTYHHTQQNQRQNKQLADALITKTITLASQKNLPIQKQMKLLLAVGIINRQCKNLTLSQQKFRNGLSICQNGGAFDNKSSSLLMKSNFLYQLGILYLQQIQSMHNPLRNTINQEYSKSQYKFRQKCQQSLKYCLEIRQKESINMFHIAQAHSLLGQYNLVLNNFIQAKNQYKKSLIKIQLVKDQISPQIKVKAYYDLGSAHYKLKEFDQAKIYYKEAINILDRTSFDDDWKFTIQGNLALARICSGDRIEGYKQLERVKEVIKNRKGTDYYDYVFLVNQETKIK